MERGYTKRFEDRRDDNIPIAMYAISGFDQPNSAPYFKSKQLHQETITNLYIVSQEDPDAEIFYTPVAPKTDTTLSDIFALSGIAKEKFIYEGLQNPDPAIRLSFIKQFQYFPDSIGIEAIRTALHDSASIVRIEAIKSIPLFPSPEREDLLRIHLQDPDPAVRLAAVEKIPLFPSPEREDLLRIHLQDPDPAVKKAIIHRLAYMPINEKTIIINSLLRDDTVDSSVKIMLMRSSGESSINSVHDTYNQMIAQGLGNALIAPNLYGSAVELTSASGIQRKPFQKTDSETTLLGGSLMNRLIIRHIRPQSFLAWQKAYENYSKWQEAGFDYVPIEPIQAFSVRDDGIVNVYSGVLDLNLEEWLKMSNFQFDLELKEQEARILQVLEEMGIEHNHPHAENFVLRFFRQTDGQPNFTSCPRLYLIDFDSAELK